MAKKMAGKTCGVCPTWLSWVTLIVGLLLVLQDLNYISTGLTGWSLFFVLIGVWGLSQR